MAFFLLLLFICENARVTGFQESNKFNPLSPNAGINAFDKSCVENEENGMFFPPPTIANGYYATLKKFNKRKKSEYLEALYVCNQQYELKDPDHHSLYCSNKKWTGELPECILSGYINDIQGRAIGVCSENKGGCDHICEEKDGQPHCICYKGYLLKEDQKKCEDINECEVNNGNCELICRNKPGSYSCACPLGYRLASNGKQCLDKNECLLNNGHGPCQDTCTNTKGGYFCSCQFPGTHLAADNHTCEDVDECAVDNFNCSHRCLNTVGSAFCACPEGFILSDDWKTCQDIDECDYPELANSCRGQCINTLGSYRCGHNGLGELVDRKVEKILCDIGFELDLSGNCIDINECATENYKCSHECINIDGAAYCECPDNMFLDEDNKTCLFVSLCSVNNDGCSHVCVDSSGDAYCLCPEGMLLSDDNKTCVYPDVSKCEQNNGGCDHVCEEVENTVICTCNSGFRKDHRNSSRCIDINECLFRNGGCNQDCINSKGSYYCACSDYYKLSEDNKTCIALSCPAILPPMHGYFQCTNHPNEHNQFAVNSQCFLRCKKGYSPDVESPMICKDSGKWSGRFPKCTPSFCPHLQRPKNGNILPSSCMTGKTLLNQHCYYTCLSGYRLTGNPVRSCRASFGWTPTTAPSCQKEAPAPYIYCPKNITVELLPHQNKVHVRLPLVKSNMDMKHITITPSWAKKMEADFAFGSTEIVFTAKNPLTKAATSCSFFVNVLDNEPPTVLGCPRSFEVELPPNTFSKHIHWKEPVFRDNVKIAVFWKSKEPDSLFHIGRHTVTYLVRDAAGNKGHCLFNINVKAAGSKRIHLLLPGRKPNCEFSNTEKRYVNGKWIPSLNCIPSKDERKRKEETRYHYQRQNQHHSQSHYNPLKLSPT